MVAVLTSRPNTLDAPLDIGRVALHVRDLEGTGQFYREVLGLQPVADGPGRVLLGAAGAGFLELLHRPELQPVDKRAAGLFHTAFLLPARADLGRWLAHAARLGLGLDGAADHLVSEAVYLHDPEGNGVEIYVDRPRDEWGWDRGQVVMANDRLDMVGLRALATTPWTGAPPGTRIGHVHLQVGDVDTAVQFYSGLLGLDVTRRWPQAAFMSTGGYHHQLAANTWNSQGAGRRDPIRAGLATVTLRAANAAVLDAIAARTGTGDLGAGLGDPWGTLIRFTVQSSGDIP